MIAIDHVEDRWLATVWFRDCAVVIEGSTFESVAAQAIAAEVRKAPHVLGDRGERPVPELDTDPDQLRNRPMKAIA